MTPSKRLLRELHKRWEEHQKAPQRLGRRAAPMSRGLEVFDSARLDREPVLHPSDVLVEELLVML